MKRFLLLFLLLPLPLFAQDESVFSSRAWREFHNALTPGGLFGVPPNTTATLPTCNSTNPGAIRWDTTALTLKVCNGTSWGAVGSASVGGAISGGTNNTVLYITNTGTIGSEAALGYSESTDILTVTHASLTGTINVSGALYFSNGASFADSQIFKNTTLTPDNLYFGTGTTGEAIHIGEYQDSAFDFNNGPCGTAACTDPQLIIHSHNQDVTQYAALSAFGLLAGGKKALPDTTGTAVFQVAVASDSGVGGVVIFTDFASDGTIQQVLTGAMQFAAVAEGTTVTCPNPTAVGTNLNAVTAGTLTCAFTCTAGTNTATINFGCNPSLTLGSQTLTWFVIGSTGQVTPQ